MKIRHINGATAEVDDELGKKLTAAGGEWKKTRVTRHRKSESESDNEE